MDQPTQELHLGSDVLRALLVALTEDRFDLGNRELVIAGHKNRAGVLSSTERETASA